MAQLNDMLVFLRKRKGLSQQELANTLKISRSAIGMYETGKREPDLETLEILADFYNVDMNTLTGKNPIITPETSTLSKKDERDIAKDLQQLCDALVNEDTLMFDGDPMSDEARASILSAMELGLQAAKMRNKEKYTAKKHRRD